jgi:hypothetical protein
MNRCYNEKYQEKRPTYLGCTVDSYFHNFQNFAKWYDENYYEIEGQRMELDKDILIKGNKIYSPETCVFVPQFINSLFVKSDTKRGGLPLGVHFDKQTKKYRASCNNGKGKQVPLGRFNSPEDAFQSYKKFKEDVIKKVAEEYKDNIPNVLYEAMINYKVEITD